MACRTASTSRASLDNGMVAVSDPVVEAWTNQQVVVLAGDAWGPQKASAVGLRVGTRKVPGGLYFLKFEDA